MRDSSSRNPGLDFARNLAIFLVIVQHVMFLGGLGNDGMGTAHKLQARFLEALSQSCVDLFGLLSGYLGVSVRGWKWRRFGSLWLQVWTTGLLVLGACTLVGSIWPSALAELPSRDDWLTAAFPLVRDEYWYFTGYLFVVLLAPLINRVLFPEGRARIGTVVAGVLFATVCGTTIFPRGVTWLPLAAGYSAAWLVCLYVFGAAVRRLEGRLASVPAAVFLGLAAVGVSLTVGQRLAMAAVPELRDLFDNEWTLSHYTSPTVLVAAVALLLGCVRLGATAGGGFGRLNAVLAPCAFGVYLLHVQPFFFRSVFTQRFGFLDRVPCGLFAASVLGLALALDLFFVILEAARRKAVAGVVSHLIKSRKT